MYYFSCRFLDPRRERQEEIYTEGLENNRWIKVWVLQTIKLTEVFRG